MDNLRAKDVILYFPTPYVTSKLSRIGKPDYYWGLSQFEKASSMREKII